MSRRSTNASVVAGLKWAEMSPRKYTAATSHNAATNESTSTVCHGCRGWPPYRTRTAAPPERTKVSPAIPMNSESRRRSLWSGLVQSAYPRWPPTEAMKAALPEVISCFRPVCGDVSRATAGQGEWVDDPVEQFLADTVGQGRLLEGEVVADGVV